MNLTFHILSDYGTIPAAIGLYLSKNNTATFKTLAKNTGLTKEQVRNGLSLMIQKRFIKYFKFEKNTLYHLDTEMVKRRLYFALYAKSISKRVGKEETGCFIKILISGTVRECDFPDSAISKLLELNYITYDTSQSVRKEDNTKMMKLSTGFLMVDYNRLNQMIYEDEMIHYVSKRYNESAADIYRAALKCENINIESIIEKLDSTKILVCDNGLVVNERSNVNEYLKYLIGGELIVRSTDKINAFYFLPCLEKLKLQKLNFLIADPIFRRVLNLIFMKREVYDKDIIMMSLVSVLKIKGVLFELQSAGLLSQRCQSEYRIGSKMEHYWYVPFRNAMLSVTGRIERIVSEKLEKINGYWDVDYYVSDTSGNDRVLVSDVLGMSKDLLIFGME